MVDAERDEHGKIAFDLLVDVVKLTGVQKNAVSACRQDEMLVLGVTDVASARAIDDWRFSIDNCLVRHKET